MSMAVVAVALCVTVVVVALAMVADNQLTHRRKTKLQKWEKQQKAKRNRDELAFEHLEKREQIDAVGGDVAELEAEVADESLDALAEELTEAIEAANDTAETPGMETGRRGACEHCGVYADELVAVCNPDAGLPMDMSTEPTFTPQLVRVDEQYVCKGCARKL